jgi:hypothetical protein
MARKYHKLAAARARLARQIQVNPATVQEPDNNNDNGDDNNNNFDCGFTGGVHCSLPDPDSDSEFEIDWDSESDSRESVVELAGEELESSLAQLRDEVTSLAEPTPYQKVAGPKTGENWKKAERSRGLGYDGHSKRTQERRLHDARAQEDFREYAKTR